MSLLPVLAAAQEASKSKTEGEVEIGIWDTTVDGSPGLVLEYEPDDTGPVVKADIQSVGEKGSVSYEGDIRATNNMTNSLDFDIDRVFRSTTVLNGLLHRLGHQPLDHFEAATHHGRVVYQTNHNPDSIYEIDYQVFETWNEIQPKGMSGLTFGFGYRYQQREGMRQETVVSHCDAQGWQCQRSLQRCGYTVFDLGVVTGCQPHGADLGSGLLGQRAVPG